ncbi:MAG: S9 family peptidase [Gammaproteobacteria bacterium]|nr:S9 family peptidase [Gammaproteobacteria bacterium]
MLGHPADQKRVKARIAYGLLCISALACAGPAIAEDAAGGDPFANLPPLIDRNVFFGDPEISGAQLSPDGKWISFRKPYRGVVNVWVKGIDQPFDAARPLTADAKRPLAGHFWTEDSRYVLFVQDEGGTEDYHVYAVDPGAEADGESGVPPARDLTPIEGIRALIYAVPEGTPGQIIVGLNDRDASLHDVYRLDIDTGERELLIENDVNVSAWITDLAGEVRLAMRERPDGGTDILVVEDGALGRVLYGCNWEETCAASRFHKDGERVYVASNKGEDLIRLLLVDVATGDAELIDVDPEAEVDLGGAVFSDATDELVATAYVGERQRIYPRTEAFANELAWVRERLPEGELAYPSSTEDETLSIVAVTSDVNPGAVYLFNRAEKTLDKLYDSRPELPSDQLANMQPIRYEARDGREIPGYLVVPKGVAPRMLPTVIIPHGGPWGRDTWGYGPLTQFLANRGYAVMSPNFRGSTGYGKRFLNEGNGEWGTGVMQHDITDGVQYLIDQGIADPDRVGIMGGSYGGYATLAGVTFTPELYAAGVSIVGPSNIITLMNSIPPYWLPVKQMFMRRVGDPDDPVDRARLESQSPFFHAENIEAPLLIIQGANDPRVKKAESEQIVVRLRELERPVEYMLAQDEGHGFVGRENRLAMFARVESFFAEHLGGRAQEGMAPDVAARLAALNVDINDVRMPEVVVADREAPKVVLDGTTLSPVTLTYEVTMQAGGQSMAMTSTTARTRATHDDEEAWRVETTLESPMGIATDTVLLRVSDLTPVLRTIQQGPMTATIYFAEGAITGEMLMSGTSTPFEVPVDGPVVGHLETALAAMPLAEGFQTQVRTFQPGMGNTQLLNLSLVGTETVETPAGSFDTYRVDLQGDDGSSGSMWVTEQQPHRGIKAEMVLPAMGGASATTVLTKVE